MEGNSKEAKEWDFVPLREHPGRGAGVHVKDHYMQLTHKIIHP